MKTTEVSLLYYGEVLWFFTLRHSDFITTLTLYNLNLRSYGLSFFKNISIKVCCSEH